MTTRYALKQGDFYVEHPGVTLTYTREISKARLWLTQEQAEAVRAIYQISPDHQTVALDITERAV